MRENVTPIYLGGKTPRLGIVNAGKERGSLCVYNGEDWEPIISLVHYRHLIPEPEPTVEKATKKQKRTCDCNAENFDGVHNNNCAESTKKKRREKKTD